MGLCACAWRLTLEVSSMGAWGATAGNVKLLLPPRQSRGISFASLVLAQITEHLRLTTFRLCVAGYVFPALTNISV